MVNNFHEFFHDFFCLYTKMVNKWLKRKKAKKGPR